MKKCNSTATQSLHDNGVAVKNRLLKIRMGALIGVIVLSAYSYSQFVLPVRVVQRERVEGCYGGWQLLAASTQDGNEVSCSSW